jgi:hypothetical protein
LAGQTVLVYRLVTANTVDQRIVERAESKRKLEKMVMHKSRFKGNGKEEKVISVDGGCFDPPGASSTGRCELFPGCAGLQSSPSYCAMTVTSGCTTTPLRR